MTTRLIVLAAGKGTRMKSAMPKVLHRLAGKPLLGHVLDTGLQLNPASITVVIGHGADQVQSTIEQPVKWAMQTEQLGTGHAVKEGLDGIEDRPVVLIYISDHGESLGEFGLYLHGTPYTIAPDVQKDIPFLVWMSARFRRETGIENADLERTEQHSHDEIFHSILGAFGMESEVYRPELDLFDR